MAIIDDYIITKKLHEGKETLIFSGYREKDAQRVVIKLLKSRQQKLPETARMKQEYELLSQLNGNGTVQVYEFGKDEVDLPIVMEYFTGQTLAELLRKNKLTTEEFLILAINIIDTLDIIHQHNIIHKNINPTNILVDMEQNQVKIIDFGLATTLHEDYPHVENIRSFSINALHYISPELTGAMNCSVDYRTDYYSLGIIFYKILTDKLPFQSNDRDELVRFHISKSAVLPTELDSSIPMILSKIIMKLLSKNPHERYQSAIGLKNDLQYCLKKIQQDDKIPSFQLAKYDISNKFHLSKKLYGREEECKLLSQVFEKASKGHAQFLYITANYTGIGKTTLVGEIHKGLVEKQGHFVSGKFDRFKRNVPYSALLQAIQSFIQQIIIKNKSKIRLWKKWLEEALGPNAQVAIDMIPSLTTIIGNQPPVPQLAPLENQNRFNLVFLNLIHALARSEHPLVIFLEDWQWADVPSLKFLESLLLHPESRHLLVIASAHEQELNENHVALETIDTLHKKGVAFSEMQLMPLKLPHVEQFLIDTLHQNKEIISPLAKLLYEKTQGNPFFMKEWMQILYDENLFQFDAKNGWFWDLNQIDKKIASGDFLNIIIDKIKKMSPSAQRTLQLAACLGNQFDLKTLSMIAEEKSLPEITRGMWEALQQGILLPTYDAYIYKFANNVEDTNINYQFLHDYFHQAIYSLVEDEYRNLFHLKIGRLLLKNTPKSQLNESVIEIVNQINQGISLVTEPEEEAEIAKLNYAAGLKAKACIAYREAFDYLRNGIALLKKNSWQSQYDLTLKLYTEAVETAFLASDFNEMKRLSDIVLKNAANIFDKMRIYEIKIGYFTNQGKMAEAVQTAYYALGLLGIKLSTAPNYFQIIARYCRVHLNLLFKNPDDLYHLPDMTDRRYQAAMRIFTAVSAATYIINPNLFLINTFESVRLSVKYGNAPESAFAYANFAIVLCGYDKYEKGYQFGRLALRMLDRFEREDLKTKVWLVVSAFVMLWQESTDKTLAMLIEGFDKCLVAGDIEFAGYTATCYAYQALYSGIELNTLAKTIKKYTNYLRPMGQKTSRRYLAIYLQAIINLLKKSSNERVKILSGDWLNEDIALSKLLEANDGPGVMSIYINKLMLNYLFADYQQAYIYATQALKYTDKVISSFIIPVFYFFYSLTCLAIYANSSPQQKKLLLNTVKQNQIKMKRWAKLSPTNYLHKYYLIEAEKMNVLGKFRKATNYFDQAIQLAKHNKCINDEALANEITARFYLLHEREKIAKAYINAAYVCYATWGANAKVQFLEKHYSHLLTPGKKIQQEESVTKFSATSVVERVTKNLDLATVIQATQAISREIELSELLTKVMNIIIDYTDAEKGYILLQKDKHWLIEASRTLDNPKVSVLQSIPFKNVLPKTIIQEVIHSKKFVLLDNASYAGKFTTDPYIQKNHSKSILCMPLIDQGTLSAIIYLENNRMVHFFTPDKLELLTLLSPQLAISIDNARLYTRIKEFNEAYERFVPHELLSLLEKNSITDVVLGDQTQKDMTVMFCGIREFSNGTEKISPDEDLAFINHFLSYMEPVITMYHGFIDKYIGYSIMAIFPQSADDALKCAIAMLQTLKRYNAERIRMHQSPVSMGIGLNSGLLMLGTVGDSYRMDGTVISDIVNIASRVENLTKTYNVNLLMTEETLNELKNLSDYSIRKIETVKIKGKSIPVTIYEVLVDDETNHSRLKNKNRNSFKNDTVYHKKKDSMKR